MSKKVVQTASREMGEKTKFSASEAAEAMNYMAMAGWKTKDMLSGIEGVMNLAAASAASMAETMNIVDTQMYIDGYQVKLVSDTSYGSLWEVSFTLKEF